MKLEKYKTALKNTPPEVREDIRLSMDILDRLHELLALKFDGKQKLLADKMGKSEAEISKLLSGVQNFTTKTLMKFQLAFEEPIIAVCSNNYEASTYALVTVNQYICQKSFQVEIDGELAENITEYKDFIPKRKHALVKEENFLL